PWFFAGGRLLSTWGGERAIVTLNVVFIVLSKPDGGGMQFAAAFLATHIRTDHPIFRLKLKC
ncbi:hypothetical protein, partial [Pseudomonas syringae group genomosp. 7]|uniref:hypothetical protein n=1 Tax=Pseudomonas syringae group genomosp. 7 TaxID=251699 RepID=UPI0037700382